MNHSQRSNGKNRKKNVNRRKQQPSVSSSTSKASANSHPSPNKSDEDDPIDEVNEAETAMENEEHDEQSRTQTDINHRDLSTPIREESVVPMKPQASVAPVKQMSPNNNYHSKHNGYPSPNHHHYSYSNHQNSLPPRFRQQLEQREAAMNNHHHHHHHHHHHSSQPILHPYRKSHAYSTFAHCSNRLFLTDLGPTRVTNMHCQYDSFVDLYID